MMNLKEILLGKPKDPTDPRIFHNISLVAFFAWVGLGADGLSSSCYGPEEAFRSLGAYTHLGLFLALCMAITVFILSASYIQIIEQFPSGGGAYVVSTKTLGPVPGLVAGSALLVDYILTVAISVASSAAAIFSFMPPEYQQWKFAASMALLLILLILNLRGIKESIILLTPVFLIFLITHGIVIFYGIFSHGSELPMLVGDTITETQQGIATIGFGGMLFIFLRAFSLGGGTFTGIEAVSNGLPLLREPRVATGKRTMKYMAFSLAFMAGGILVAYLLNNVESVPGQTLNATLVHRVSDAWPGGQIFFLVTMLSEGALLMVAAQAGFLAGPRTMSNMSLDNWLPHRFKNLSERLVIKDGVLVIGVAAAAILYYTQASVHILVVMYSINVFVTFALGQLGMIRLWLNEKTADNRGMKLLVQFVALALTSSILAITIVIKFGEGGWVTILITGSLIGFCWWVSRHYAKTQKALSHLNEILSNLPFPEMTQAPEKKAGAPAAVLMVAGYNGLGIHSILALHRAFPGHFKNLVFLSVGVIDTDRFKGVSEIDNLKASIKEDLDKYVKLANKMGFYAESAMTLETNTLEGLETLCEEVNKKWVKKMFFAGQLVFENETWWSRLLHSQTAFMIQRKLIFKGMESVVLPIRVRLR